VSGKQWASVIIVSCIAIGLIGTWLRSRALLKMLEVKLPEKWIAMRHNICPKCAKTTNGPISDLHCPNCGKITPKYTKSFRKVCLFCGNKIQYVKEFEDSQYEVPQCTGCGLRDKSLPVKRIFRRSLSDDDYNDYDYRPGGIGGV